MDQGANEMLERIRGCLENWPNQGCDSVVAAAVEKIVAEAVRPWREWAWLHHGCPTTALYGDDGEMQCRQCERDFLRQDPRVWRQQWRDGVRS